MLMGNIVCSWAIKFAHERHLHWPMVRHVAMVARHTRELPGRLPWRYYRTGERLVETGSRR